MFKDRGIWSEVEKLREGVDDVLKNVGLPRFMGRFPAYALHSLPGEYVAVVELPGVAKGDVGITYRDRQLILKGNMPASSVGEGAQLLRSDLETGPFERAISIPTEVDKEGIRAQFQDGLLTVRLPKVEAEKARDVPID